MWEQGLQENYFVGENIEIENHIKMKKYFSKWKWRCWSAPNNMDEN